MKKILVNISVVCLFLIPLFPLLVSNSYFFPFITGKAFLFRFLVEIAFASWAVLAFMDAKYRPRLTKTTYAVLIFALITLIADIFGVNPMRSIWSNFERMEGWITIIHLVAFYFVINGILGNYNSNQNSWHRWFSANLGVGSVVGVYGLLQLAKVLEIHQGSSRVDATLGNSAYMAVYLLFVLGFAVFMFLSDKNRWSFKVIGDRNSNLAIFWGFIILSIIVLAYTNSSIGQQSGIDVFFSNIKVFVNASPWLFLLGLIIVALTIVFPFKVLPLLFVYLLFQTQTRGTIIGLLGGMVIALIINSFLTFKKHKTRFWFSTGAIAIIVILVASFWSLRHSSFVKNNEVLNRLATISLNDVKTQARGYVWPMALKGASQKPILGWGQENFNYIFNANYEPAMYKQEQWFDRAHSVFLDWLVASGVIGVIAYLSLYVFILLGIKKSNLTIGKKAVLVGLLAGYFVHNIFVFDNLASYVMFFALLAFANSLNNEKEKIFLGHKNYDKDAIEYVVLPIVVVVLLGSLYFVQYRLMSANKTLLNALIYCSNGRPTASIFESALAINSTTANQEIREQLLNCSSRVIPSNQIPIEIRQQFLTLTSDEIAKQLSYAPKDARMYVLGGTFMNNIGQYKEAAALLEKGLELSPHKQSIIFELVTSYLNLGNSNDKAIELIKEAYNSSPDSEEAKLAYATTLLTAGKESQAKELFKDNPGALVSPQIAQVYINKKQYNKAIEIFKTLVKNDPKNLNLRSQLAQIYIAAGQKYDAIEILRTISNDYPEYKEQVENAIKQIK